MDLVYPSSLTAWSRKYLPDGSSEEDNRTRLDIPDNVLASRTHGMSQGPADPAWIRPRQGRRDLGAETVLRHCRAGQVTGRERRTRRLSRVSRASRLLIGAHLYQPSRPVCPQESST